MASTYYLININNGVVAFYEVPDAGGTLDLSADPLCVCGQVSKAAITAAANSTDVPATFCTPKGTRNTASTFTLDVEGIQDWGRDDGESSFSEFLFEHDSGQVIAVLYKESGGMVKAVAEVSVAAGDFLGAAGETLTFTGTLPVTGYPDIYSNTGGLLRKGAGGSTSPSIPISGETDCGQGSTTTATGVTSGTPGAWVPASAVPADLAAANALVDGGPANGFIEPTAPWTTGEYVVLGNSLHTHWDDIAGEFATGDAP